MDITTHHDEATDTHALGIVTEKREMFFIITGDQVRRIKHLWKLLRELV